MSRRFQSLPRRPIIFKPPENSLSHGSNEEPLKRKIKPIPIQSNKSPIFDRVLCSMIAVKRSAVRLCLIHATGTTSSSLQPTHFSRVVRAFSKSTKAAMCYST